jgi:hypothetical protein
MDQKTNKCINIADMIKAYRNTEKLCDCDPNKNRVYSPVIKDGPCRNCYGTLRKTDEVLIAIFMNR